MHKFLSIIEFKRGIEHFQPTQNPRKASCSHIYTVNTNEKTGIAVE